MKPSSSAAVKWIKSCLADVPPATFKLLLHHKQHSDDILVNPFIEAAIYNSLSNDLVGAGIMKSSWAYEYNPVALGIELPEQPSGGTVIESTKWSKLIHADSFDESIFESHLQSVHPEPPVTASVLRTNNHNTVASHFWHLTEIQAFGQNWTRLWDEHSFSWQHACRLGEVLSRIMTGNKPTLTSMVYIPLTVNTIAEEGRPTCTGKTHRFFMLLYPVEEGCALQIILNPWSEFIRKGAHLAMKNLQWWKKEK